MLYNVEPVEWIAVTISDNGLGDETETEAPPQSLVAAVAGRSSETPGIDQPAVTTDLVLYLRSTDVVPGASDRFVVRGDSYEVDGKAHRWGRMGVEVPIRRTEGRP